MKKRIAILANFPTTSILRGAQGRGGGQTCTWLPQLAKAFEAQKEFEIHWIILDREGWRGRTLHHHGQTFHLVPSVRFSLDVLLGYLPARIMLRAKIRELKPALVHAWGTEHIYPAALQDFNGPKILSMQGILTEYARIKSLPDTWIWRRMIRSEPEFMRAADVVTTESEWGAERVREACADAKVRIIEYGVHPSFYEIPWQPSREAPYALFIGGADFRKGYDVLIESLQLLSGRTWEIRMAGDPRLGELCKSAGLIKYQSLGLLSWEELKKQLQAAWCVVLPTRGDTSPNSVKEARVVGVPVVTTSHGGQSGYIADKENGRILTELSAHELSKALHETMASFESVVQLGKGRHEADRMHFRPENTAESFAMLYKELLSNFGI